LANRLGCLEPAATIAGFALSPMAATGVPEITTVIAHLRDVLGDQTYESLARKGKAMTTAAMVAYAYDQIDQARSELNAVSEETRMRHPSALSAATSETVDHRGGVPRPAGRRTTPGRMPGTNIGHHRGNRRRER
jgi:hypothetical protein